jgi:hypothetical protein
MSTVIASRAARDSVRPTVATSGRVKIVQATFSRLIGAVAAPNACSAVDHDRAALVELDADRVEAEAGCVGALSHADDRVRAAEGAAVLGADDDAVLVGVDVDDPGVHLDLDAASQERLLHELGDVVVLGGEDLVAGAEQRHLAAG